MVGEDAKLNPLQPTAWPIAARLARWRAMTRQVVARSEQLVDLADDELLTHGREQQWRARSGVPLKKLLVESYALVREAARRSIGLEPYPVQVMGGIGLFEGGIAEMQTGEGKTLTAVLPAFLRALPGRGCHIITVNDYLATRDAETMGPVFAALGISVGCIQTPMESDERRTAYARDVTYGTSKEMGFDFLRDRLRQGVAHSGTRRHGLLAHDGGNGQQSEPNVQRGHHFALVDEADSVLIDEARTPLIIGLTQPNDPASVMLFRWCFRNAARLDAKVDYKYEARQRNAYLTEAGCRKVVLLNKPGLINSVDSERIYRHIEQAITALHAYQRDRDYVVVDDEVVIVDEGTGRIMDGRKWQDGLHQAIEAKEQMPITATSGEAARVTIQSFFREYSHLAGMTGTAIQAARELKKTYGRSVTPIPTHRPCIRTGRPPRIFVTMQAKREAIVEEIASQIEAGRAVLVGTPSVEASEGVSELLERRGITHQVLNATRHEHEADIVARAGEVGKVTVATNMAGRGTDIQLSEELAASGGLTVIATELHSSARIDRQLIGRAARQGDPGGFQFFLSLDDELLRCLDADKLARLRGQARPGDHGQLSTSWLPFFRRTQRLLERQHRRQRRELLKHEKQRNQSYRRMGLDPCLELTES